MSGRLADIRHHRAALIERAAFQRRRVGEILDDLNTPISLVDRIMNVFQRLRVSPMVIPAGAAMLFWLRRRYKWLWAGHLMTAWKIFSSLRRMRASRS